MKGIFLSDREDLFRMVWQPDQQARLRKLAEVPERIFRGGDLCADGPDFREVEVIFSAWGMPMLEDGQLARLPRLRAVFYAAGTTRAFAAPLLRRGILIATARQANAVPVAEYALSQILFGLKAGWRHVRAVKASPGPQGWKKQSPPGAYGTAVGVISLGAVGCALCGLLRHFSVEVLAFDPLADARTMAELGVRPATLEEIFARCEVVTLHAPLLEQTTGLISGTLLSSMKEGATFVNTSRGALVRQDEMTEVLRRRSDLTAVLDVTYPEPPAAESPLYRLPNVVLTPHISGSQGSETRRLADFIINEFTVWQAGGDVSDAVTAERLPHLA